jgi:hypothetical protein
MKKCLYFLTIFIAILVIGCERQNPVESATPSTSGSSSGILLKVNGSTLADSTVMENRTQIIFVLQINFAYKSVTTTFSDDGTVLNGILIQHAFKSGIPSTSIKIVAIDQANVSHQKIYKFGLVASVSIPSVVWVSKTAVGDGTYKETFLFLKEIMQDYKGPYASIGLNGSFASNVLFTDDNKIYSNGVIIDPPSGQVGNYVMGQVIDTPNSSFDGGVGRIDPVNGLNWIAFDGPFASGNHIKYHTSATGDVTPGGAAVANLLPGDIGDTGPNPVTRYGVLDSTRITILVNNFAPWVSGSSFILPQNPDGLFATPVVQAAVPGYANWGKLDILASNIPANGKLVYNFGNLITSPFTFNPNASSSLFFSPAEGVLKVIIQRKIGLNKSSAGQPRQYWSVSIQ